jgi:hypothetical protein
MAFVHLSADYFVRDVYGSTGPQSYGFAVDQTARLSP